MTKRTRDQGRDQLDGDAPTALDPVLEKEARTAAESWVEAWRAQLGRQGRRVAGGWPGTIPEAQVVVRAHLARAVGQQRLAALGSHEVERLARVAYARARQQWLAHAEREPPESGARPSDEHESLEDRRTANQS